jgi:deoxyribodipyrimidine photo-lyase
MCGSAFLFAGYGDCMPSPPHDSALVWFRDDLRVSDHPALNHARDCAKHVTALYVLDELGESGRPPGAAAQWWLSRSLQELSKKLDDKHIRLVLKKGKASAIVPDVARQLGASLVCWNRRYEPAQVKADTAIKEQLAGNGLDVKSFNGNLLFEPWEIAPKSSPFYKVFTPFWKAAQEKGGLDAPLREPEKAAQRGTKIASEKLQDWGLEPEKPNWAEGFEEHWTPGEDGAHDRLYHFLERGLKGYDKNRDLPDRDGTSRLSPYLRFGNISPRQIWHALHHHHDAENAPAHDRERFLSEIGWREFNYHLLYHLPDLATYNVQPKFKEFPWKYGKRAMQAWEQGMTGYPVVDAAMRQLWQTGWMHNRMRMVVASFFVKHLLHDWRDGEKWFWDTLVDGDVANNSANWQWVAGCGADAAPFFRVFNPILQGEKFDPKGHYVREFVPEIAGLPDKFIHKPWMAGKDVLQEAGVELGKDYPEPIVDHKQARDAALKAFKEL